ncbi:hypothetical protein FHS93_003984 [Sphingobium francense]|nr:hypothetical protein [Sphingobium indicum]
MGGVRAGPGAAPSRPSPFCRRRCLGRADERDEPRKSQQPEDDRGDVEAERGSEPRGG